MQNLSAQVTSDFLQFPDVTIKALQEDDIQLDSVLRAKFTTGKARLAWLACGPQLEVNNVLTGERLSAYRFRGVTERPPTVVTVKEFSWQKKTGLLVGLVEAESSVLCLYNVSISRVVKAVVLPGSVTLVEPIINNGGPSTSIQPLHQSLRWFFGVAAVVTDVGHVLLIDLCLDDVSGNQDELEASDLEVMSGIPANIPKLREAASRERRHLCLQLQAPTGTSVTALSFISRTNQLAVGFSDGYLSLWNMKTLRREYHVQIEGGKVPVSAVTFQEPENDPRNCCYLWAVQSSESGQDVSLHLLQLAFGDRKCLSSGQIIYEHLEYCEERYSLDLSASSLSLRSQTNSTKLLGCQTIEKFRVHNEREDGLHEVTSPDSSVTVFSWQVVTYGHGKPSLYMAVFDINRWYQAQMPDSLRPGQFLRNCSYIAFWSLEAVLNVTQDSIFDMLVHERSFSRGAPTSYPPPEQFYYPSTYNYDATCLLSSGIVHITCIGFQKETLCFLKNSGSSFKTIQEGYSRCLVAGLLSPRLADVQPTSLSQEEQLQAVLSTAVETSSISLLTRCIKVWTAEEQPRSAANLRFVLEWTWDKVTLVKRELDRLCVPLFDGSCNFIDPQTLNSLHRCHLRLKNLTTVLSCFITEAQNLTKQGLIDLANKQSVTKLLAQYASIVLWFCRCGLLPDYSDDAMQLTRPCYNYSLMQQYYDDRRKKLDHLSRGKWDASSLMIDGMLGQLGEKVEELWKRDGGTGRYPPATLHALLDLYLLENADDISKHAITIYFLLDIMYSFPDKPDSAIESFPNAFSVPCGLVKLIQGFWLLDHNDYQNSLDCILHPAASRVMGWQHNQIIETLLCQGEHRQAVRYIQVMKPPAVTMAEVKLQITVLLANRNLIEAWNLQRLHSSRLNEEELLMHVYETCQEMGLIEDLLKLAFTDSEQGSLQRFLQTSGGLQNQELLLVYHLQRANYIPALQLNQSLKSYDKFVSDRRLRERAVARNAILQQYGKTLPGIQRTLANEGTKHSALSSTVWKEVTRPKPLSTIVKQAPSGSVISKATFIGNVLMKIKEVATTDVTMDFSPYKSVTTEEPTPASSLPPSEVTDAFIGTPVAKSRRVSRLLDSIVNPILTESSPLDANFELVSERTPRKSATLMTSSPVPSNLRKIAQLRSLSKASEFNLLETPVVVKRAKALAASSISSVFTAHTPQSILRSSARSTPLASPSVSPGRSITPPLRPRESKISFMEQISNKYTKGVLTPDKDMASSSPLIKAVQDTVWPERMALSINNTFAKDLDELDESSSGIQDGSPSRMEISRNTSNVSARSDQTTLEYHDAPTPEDLEEDLVVTAKSETPADKDSSSEVVDSASAEIHLTTEVQEVQYKDPDEENTDSLAVCTNDRETLLLLTSVQEVVTSVECAVEEEEVEGEDEASAAAVDPESVSSTRDSVSVISIHDSEDIGSANSENLNEENEEVEFSGEAKEPAVAEDVPVIGSPPSLDVDEGLHEVAISAAVIMSCPEVHPAADDFQGDDHNIDDQDKAEHLMETDEAEVEHAGAADNFSLILEEEGEAGEGEAAEPEMMPSEHPVDRELHTVSEMAFSVEYTNPPITITDPCPTNAFTLVDSEKNKILETLPYAPEPIKVAVEENSLNVFKGTDEKDLLPEVVTESAPEIEPVKKRRGVHASRTPSKRKGSKSEDVAVDGINPTTPPKKTQVEILGGAQEKSPKEDLSEVKNPLTPTRTVRRSSRFTENTSAEPELQLPVTPRRGRRAKVNEETVTLSTLQEEPSPSQIFSRKRSHVSEKTQNTEVELSVKEDPVQIPTSPARTRKGKAVTEQTSKDNEVPDPKVGIVTPTRITRSSKLVQESEAPTKATESENEPEVTTPTRGRRGKRAVNELVKQFEQNATQISNKADSSPPVSPKKVPLRWSRIKENPVDHETVEQEPVPSQEQIADTPRKRLKRSTVSKPAEEPTTISEHVEENTVTIVTKRGIVTLRSRKSVLPLVAEETAQDILHPEQPPEDRLHPEPRQQDRLHPEPTPLSEDRLHPEPPPPSEDRLHPEPPQQDRLHPEPPLDSHDMVPNTETEEQPKSVRLTRTRSSNVLSIPDASTVTFAFTTPTPRRKRAAKVEPAAQTISPESLQPSVTPQFVFSPPSTRTRRTVRNLTSVPEKKAGAKVEESQNKVPDNKETKVVVEQVLRRPRGRPPKHKGNKTEKPVVEVTWSPPPVEIQLLSPPESPDADGGKSLPQETKAANQKPLRISRRRVVSQPVTRRKIR